MVIELFHQDGKPAGVFYCAKCRSVKRTKAEADKCCEPSNCQYCGKESGRQYVTVCDTCKRANQIKYLANRFEKAKKLTEWEGWVYLDGTGNDGFSESLSSFWEDWDDNHTEDKEKPAYVWGCKRVQLVRADVSDITDRISDDADEDFDTSDMNGLEDLEMAIEKFNKANEDVVSYEPDYGVAILLNNDSHVEQRIVE